MSIDRILTLLFILILSTLVLYALTYANNGVAEILINIVSLAGFVMAIIEFVRKRED